MGSLIIIILLILIILFNIFVFLLKIRKNTQEEQVLDIFKRRNYQVISIYSISKQYVMRHKKVFENFLELKRRDFQENMHHIGLEEKLPTYKNIHSEINFIFKVCEKHPELKKNEIYNYIKESLLKKSDTLGEEYELFTKANNEFKKFHLFAKCTLLGFFY